MHTDHEDATLAAIHADLDRQQAEDQVARELQERAGNLQIEQDRIEALRQVGREYIARCPLVPGVEPKIESYRGIAGKVEWFVAVEGATVRDWQVTGPNADSPLAAVALWNSAWVKS